MLQTPSPWISVINEEMDNILATLKQKKIKILIICGDCDEDCAPLTRMFHQKAAEKKIDIKTSNLTVIKDNKNLNLNGLDKLNISESQQFSEYNLPLLIKAIGNSLSITVVDLRQESHGFINGFAVSWADSLDAISVKLGVGKNL